MARKNIKSEEDLYAAHNRCADLLGEARKHLLKYDNVIGVGCGLKQQRGVIDQDQPAIVVYVTEKKENNLLKPNQTIPQNFKGVPIDIIVPGSRSPEEANQYDIPWLDLEKLSSLEPVSKKSDQETSIYDQDNIVVMQIDESDLLTFTFQGSQYIYVNYARVLRRFYENYPDIYDFISFFADSTIPSQGSWNWTVYNDIKGINIKPLNLRWIVGSEKLEAFHSISSFSNRTMLQEAAHRWAAFVRNRDRKFGIRKYELLIGRWSQQYKMQARYHWGRYFDNDHSPVDYDSVDWEQLEANKFKYHSVQGDFSHFCPLDLYLMGLIPPDEVGDMYVIKNPEEVVGETNTVTGEKKELTVQNVIWAEGERVPAYPDTQKDWKNIFVILTMDEQVSDSFMSRVSDFRRAYSWEFYKATAFLGRAETRIGAGFEFPEIKDITTEITGSDVTIRWMTDLPAFGKVYYSDKEEDFGRRKAHAISYMETESENGLGTSHQVTIANLQPGTAYYFEVIAETGEGLFDQEGILQFET